MNEQTEQERPLTSEEKSDLIQAMSHLDTVGQTSLAVKIARKYLPSHPVAKRIDAEIIRRNHLNK